MTEMVDAKLNDYIVPGHVVSRRSVEPGGISISASVHDNGKELAAAIDISCPASAFDVSVLETRYFASLVETTRRISIKHDQACRALPSGFDRRTEHHKPTAGA